MKGVEAHVERFSGRAPAYALYREDYDPAIILPRLREWCDLESDWLIADVGAGTGMLSDVFLDNGNRVIGIEPNAEMRGICVDAHRSQALLEVRDGTAENTGLTDASVDMVFVGRALHWFDLSRCMPEFRRILKPGGWIAVVAFGRMETGRKENEAYEQLMRTASSQETTRATYKVYGEFATHFADGKYHHEQIDGAVSLSWPALRGLTLSMSHAPLETDAVFSLFEEQLHNFFRTYERDGQVELRTHYWINAGRFAIR